MKRFGEDSYSQFLHKLKDFQNYYLESKQITEFQSLCDDMLLEQFRSVLPDEDGAFVDQRNVSSATEMAKLAVLFTSRTETGIQKLMLDEIFILVAISLLNLKISRRRMLISNRVKTASMQ